MLFQQSNNDCVLTQIVAGLYKKRNQQDFDKVVCKPSCPCTGCFTDKKNCTNTAPNSSIEKEKYKCRRKLVIV